MTDPGPGREDELAAYRYEHGLPWGPIFRGKYPFTVSQMSRDVLGNITVHLANEHRVSPDKIPFEQLHWRHALAHVYGEFRPGQEHYHDKKDN